MLQTQAGCMIGWYRDSRFGSLTLFPTPIMWCITAEGRFPVPFHYRCSQLTWLCWSRITVSAHMISTQTIHIYLFFSGVTRVGDTRGGNWGCHPSIFFLKNLPTLFAHRCLYHYRFLLLSLGCHPLEGVTPSRVGCHLFYLSDLVSPLFFVNLRRKFFSFGCHPLEGVTRGGPPPPLHTLVTPLFFPTFWVFLASEYRHQQCRLRHRVHAF